MFPLSLKRYLSFSFLQLWVLMDCSFLQWYKLPRPLDYVAYLLHMAVFGILGVSHEIIANSGD